MKSRWERFVGLLGLCVVAVVASTESASAQYSPPLSPWLSMYNQNRGGILDNYHTFVMPQFEAQKEFAQQQSQQKDMQRQIDQILNPPKKRPSFTSSGGAGYRQHLHYYRGLPQGGPPYHGKR